MATKTDTADDKPLDPLEHVNMILDAEPKSPTASAIPMVTEQSQKLSEMADSATNAITEKVTEDVPKGSDPEPVKLPPMRAFESPRQAAPKAPKEATVHDYEPRPAGRRRRNTAATPEPTMFSGGSAPATTQLTGEHVAGLLKMVHAIGSTVLGPSFAIPDESAKAIGDAAIPVLEDFGVVVASRAVHLMMLVSTVAMIEGPIVFAVVNDMKARAENQKNGYSTMAMAGSAGAYSNNGPTDEEVARAISLATGVQVGNAS